MEQLVVAASEALTARGIDIIVMHLLKRSLSDDSPTTKIRHFRAVVCVLTLRVPWTLRN